jgi:N,N'-diacetyllegionaminate synthase
MSFKKRYLSDSNSIYFIAEIGINHNGVFDLAIQMIDESKKSGASAVKFQKRDPKCLLLEGVEIEVPTGYLSQSPDDFPDESKAFGSWNYPDIRLEFTDEQHLELWKYSEKLGMDYIVSPWDENSLDFLVNNKAKVIKIPSIDTSNFWFMELVASKKIPVIASVGMCNWSEINTTWQIFEKARCPLMFLHCVSAYPSELKDKNLNCIPIIQNLFNEDVGFSGHGIGATGTLGAVALGADVIEKHVTLSRKMSGPDQGASLEFNEVTSLIDEANNTKIALGTTNKIFQESEAILHGVLAKKIILSKDLNKGDSLSYENIRTVVTKSVRGILPNKYYEIINKVVTRDLPRNHILENSDIT